MWLTSAPYHLLIASNLLKEDTRGSLHTSRVSLLAVASARALTVWNKTGRRCMRPFLRRSQARVFQPLRMMRTWRTVTHTLGNRTTDTKSMLMKNLWMLTQVNWTSRIRTMEETNWLSMLQPKKERTWKMIRLHSSGEDHLSSFKSRLRSRFRGATSCQDNKSEVIKCAFKWLIQWLKNLSITPWLSLTMKLNPRTIKVKKWI